MENDKENWLVADIMFCLNPELYKTFSLKVTWMKQKGHIDTTALQEIDSLIL